MPKMIGVSDAPHLVKVGALQFSVIGPLVPEPISLPSIEFIGTTSAAVPEKKDSSDSNTSSKGQFFYDESYI